jgi:peroxin-6
VYWEDIGGLEEAKQEIIDTVEMPIKYPDLFETQRTGVLLYGPPGTGKTLLAKAVATECGLNFISVKGPELLNMYVGESERNVRDVFERARNAKPCVLFFDEIDSIAPRRGQGSDGGGVVDRVVSQILTELDGMDDSKDVFLIAATNRPDLLDPALMRPGRLDKQIYLGIAEDIESKVKIIKALTRNFRLAEDCDLEALVQCLPNGFTGADYYALCSDALMRRYRKKIDEINSRVAKLQRRQPGKHTVQTVLASLSQEELNVCVHLGDFLAASRDLTPSLTPAEIERYRELRSKLNS